MRIGYDFDGVFHKNVTTTDGLGERNYVIPTNNLIEFYEMLDKIRKEIKEGHEIFIISRGKREEVIDNLKKLFVYKLFDEKNIITDLGEKNILKSQIIKEKGIDEFFDDSIFNIHDINKQKKKNNLRTKLYLVNPETDSYKRIRSKNIKILSYNVNWQNMLSSNFKMKECNEKDLCASNINKLIKDELPLDFILLQEFENQDILLSELLDDFDLFKTKSDKESMVTLVNKKYKVTKEIAGEFEKGRPFLIVFINFEDKKICLINVHMAHKKQHLIDFKLIEEKIREAKDINIDEYRIIIGGDFNEEIGTNIPFCGKYMHNFFKKLTCCINSTHMNKNNSIMKYLKGKNIDHILDSQEDPVYTLTITPLHENKLIPASDHLALYSELSI